MDKISKKAVALKYEIGKDAAPQVVAKGKGSLANKIIKIAQTHGVHVYYDPDLTEVLYKLELLEEIPPHLYQAVAEVLAFVYFVSKKWRTQQKEKS